MKRLLTLIMVAAVLGGLAIVVRQLGQGTVPQGDRPLSSAKAVYYCPMHPGYTSETPGDCAICNMKLVKRERDTPAAPAARKIVYWTDPMLPGYRSDAPGKSPMGMDLVPVYEASDTATPLADPPTGYAAVTVAPDRRQLIGVTTAVVERRPLTKTIRTVGRIAYDPELYQAEQEYVEALAAEGSEPLAAAARTRLRLLGLNDDLLEALVERGAPDRRLLLTGAGGQAWLYATLYEIDLPWVAAGQAVTVEVPSALDRPLAGVIRAVDPVLDPMTRSVKARVLLDDPDGLLKPELFVNVSIRVPVGESVAVPREAVLETGTRRIVFVDRGEGVLEPREVTVRAEADGYYAVTAGVSAGEPVVTGGNFLVDSESRLRAAIEGVGGRND